MNFANNVLLRIKNTAKGFEIRTNDHDDDGILEFKREIIAAFLKFFRNNDSSLANNGQMDHASPRQYCLKLSDVN